MGKQQFTIDTLYETLKKYYQSYLIEFDNFKTVYAAQGGTVNDYAWAVFQHLIIEIAKSYHNGEMPEEDYYRKLRDTYWEMTLFQRRYENKKGNHTFQQYLLNDLLWNNAKETQLQLNAIVIPVRGCCEYCDSVDGITVPIDEAIKKQQVDANKCKHEYGCRITYGYLSVRDSNGRLITK